MGTIEHMPNLRKPFCEPQKWFEPNTGTPFCRIASPYNCCSDNNNNKKIKKAAFTNIWDQLSENLLAPFSY